MGGNMLKIGIIIGSTRPTRVGADVGKWVYEFCKNRSDTEAEFELIDIKDYDLPLLDEPVPPSMATEYTKDHTKKWSSKIDELDAYIFVSPEYNHSTSGALKNAIDFLYKEWNDKAAGFVAYGSLGGTRAVEHLRLIMAEVQVATVRAQVAFSLMTDFENFTEFKPASYHEKNLNQLIDQLLRWGKMMRSIRVGDVSEELLIDVSGHNEGQSTELQ